MKRKLILTSFSILLVLIIVINVWNYFEVLRLKKCDEGIAVGKTVGINVGTCRNKMIKYFNFIKYDHTERIKSYK